MKSSTLTVFLESNKIWTLMRALWNESRLTHHEIHYDTEYYDGSESHWDDITDDFTQVVSRHPVETTAVLMSTQKHKSIKTNQSTKSIIDHHTWGGVVRFHLHFAHIHFVGQKR